MTYKKEDLRREINNTELQLKTFEKKTLFDLVENPSATDFVEFILLLSEMNEEFQQYKINEIERMKIELELYKERLARK
jgi:hypothetical protein